MADVVSMERGADGVFSRSKGMDALWSEAEALGRVSVEARSFDDGYRATIQFKTRTGSMIFAKGESSAAVDALVAAIVEARSLGAV